MDKKQIKAIEKLNIKLTKEQLEFFEAYTKFFLETNSKLNLISKKEEEFLFEKHIFDSLAINLFIPQGKIATLLDFGTGGGFPALPLAIANPTLKVTALDSIQKKINAVENIKQELNLENLETICTRVENFEKEFDYVTSRAVSSLDNILKYANKKLKKGGYFIAFKSSKIDEELEEAKNTLKKLPLKLVKIIDYKLPIENPPVRNLVIFKKN